MVDAFTTGLAGTPIGFGTPALFGTAGLMVDLPIVSLPASSEAGHETAQDVVLPQGAVVTRAVLRVSAQAPAGRIAVGDIATVRAAAGDPGSSSDEIVVDFGVLRTVSSVGASGIRTVHAWRGTSFDQFVAEGSGPVLDFTEVQTERLLLSLSSAAAPAAIAELATVTTATPPADLELLVGGARVWMRAGPAPAGFEEAVDVTSALQAAVDAGPAGADGTVRVALLLRARVAGTLGLEPTGPIGFLRTHPVAFPAATTTRVFDEEGELVLALPLPAGAEAWTVHRVLATVAATDDDPRRVLPPVGPAPTAEARLTVDPDRRLVVRVPAERLAPFERLSGIRVSAQPGEGGVELAGALLQDAGGAPGEPLPKGALAPVTVAPGASPAWVTLAPAQPVRLPAGEPLWFSLAATRGSADVELGTPAGPAEDATLARVMPNGAVRPMSSPVGVRTDVLRLRLAGLAPESAPIAVLDVDLAGGATVREPVDPALAAAGLHSLAPATPGPRPGLALRLQATARTGVTVGPVVVAYSDPAMGGP